MRKLILTIVTLMVTPLLFGQMIFESGSWAEVKEKALKENRLIFIDIYTEWCGPCKVMVKNIFPLKESGDFYNNNFINYKIDAEKGEGIEIAKEYGVNSYPTYLFVDGNGKLFYTSGGSMPLERFLAEGKKALELTEQVTLISERGVTDSLFEKLKEHFTENEIAQLIIAINQINFWNRLAVASKNSHPL